MKLCFSWLKALADFEWDPEELVERLTLSGTECTLVGPLFEGFSGVVVGKVEECEALPNFDRLKLCSVDTGSNVLTSLCGAPNVRAGQKVAFAAPGAELPGGIRITAVEKQGVKSEGMICSEAELGLSDDHSVTMELNNEIRIGSSVRDALELDDWLIEFDLTPNRPDCLSAIGIAREIAALTGTKVKVPDFELDEGDDPASGDVEIEIECPDGCPRYMARIIRGVDVGSTPWWMKKRLYSTGLRSISNVVDITNYVMMETGHPLHAFDFDRFSAQKVLVRYSKNEEKFVTLDNVERKLPPETVMITDSAHPVAIGGIMGGLDSEVDETTKNILLESAYFNPRSILRSRKKLGLMSESQTRFEKGADPSIVPYACDRAAYLIHDLAGGNVMSGQVDCYPRVIEPVLVRLRPTRVNQILSTNLAAPQMIDILTVLEFGVRTGKELDVTVPTFRPDVTREIDLIEEIARIHGVDRIKASETGGGPLVTPMRKEDLFYATVRGLMTNLGFVEALTNTLIDPDKDKIISQLENHLHVLSPVSPELAAMRQNMQYSMINIVSYNMNRQQDDVAFFEIGRVFVPSAGELPDERDLLGIAIAGRDSHIPWDREPREYDFFDLKGCVEDLVDELMLGEFSLEPSDHTCYEPGVSFNIRLNGVVQGRCGEISSTILNTFDIDRPLYTAEIEIGTLVPSELGEREFKPVPKYPSSYRDIAIVVDTNVLVEQVQSTIMEAGSRLVRRVSLFDVYEGRQVAEGKKSLAFNIEFRSDDKTLTDNEIDLVYKAMVERLERDFSAELRSQ